MTGVITMADRFRKAAHVFVVASILPAVILVMGGVTATMNVSAPLYRPTNEVEAFEWLRGNGEQGDVVLAAYDTANPLPAWTPMRSLVGHGPESVHLEEINALVESFYEEGTSDVNRMSLIEDFAV